MGRNRSRLVERAHESDWSMRLGMGLAAILVLLLGIVPGPVVAVLQTAVQNQQTLWRSFADMQKVWWFGSGSYAVYAPLLLLTVLSVILLAVALMTCGDKSFVHREVTWNCGTYPTARQQYSATGFSKPLRRAFDFLLKPKRTATYLKRVIRILGGRWNINYRSRISLQKSYMYRFSTIWSGLLLFCVVFSRAAYVCISVM